MPFFACPREWSREPTQSPVAGFHTAGWDDTFTGRSRAANPACPENVLLGFFRTASVGGEGLAIIT